MGGWERKAGKSLVPSLFLFVIPVQLEAWRYLPVKCQWELYRRHFEKV
jgi:hypothetical protein